MTEDDIAPQLGHLTIADLDFIIDCATIAESEDAEGQRRWDLWIGTAGRKMEFPPYGSFHWAPNIRGDSVRVQGPSFESIVGQTVLVPAAYDYERDEYLFTMYVFEHSDVFDSRIRFLDRQRGIFRIEWRGKCNIHFSKTYGESVPFAFLADVQIRNS